MTGRPIGSLATFKCCICGTVERVKGGTSFFRCVACKTSGKFHNDDFHFYYSLGARAKGAVTTAIRNGVLARPSTQICVDCGEEAAGYDHRDYNKPLNVDPVCRVCNHKRGPAIPQRGFLTWAFQSGFPPYRKRKDAIRLLSIFGISADSESMPPLLGIEHWLPYRDALLATELCDSKATEAA